ncbi:hypothetical protein GCM10020367_69810 [Streptomyces sannanensis]|uniref:Uncharacterized protein n=1 Tax=Streptomyces sannanensis TaxID=285536 RepID=A0ABP6SNJ4_9ACTN
MPSDLRPPGIPVNAQFQPPAYLTSTGRKGPDKHRLVRSGGASGSAEALYACVRFLCIEEPGIEALPRRGGETVRGVW